jgi:galactokinase
MRPSAHHRTAVARCQNAEMTDLEMGAAGELEAAFGPGTSAASGVAPGRVTLLGEHVDYVSGRIACMAIDLTLAVAVRPSADGHWRVVSDGHRVERPAPSMARDIGDRVFAAASALGRFGVVLPPLDIGVASRVPRSSGLSSSAALTAASLVAMLRLAGARLSSDDLVAAALIAEREIVGVPCGDLDPLAVVYSRAGSVLLLDCATGSRETRGWPWPEIGLVVASSGERHDVQGTGYRTRRAMAERACVTLGASGCQEIGDRWRDLPGELRAAGRHIATETRRTDAAIAALEAGDAHRLGVLVNESHESLSSDYRISTERLDAMTAAARRVPGCYGARLVGGGFGGSALALVDRSAADACAAAMAAAAIPDAGTWLIEPSAGVAVLAPDVVTSPT